MRRVPFTLSFKLPLLVALAVVLTALVGSAAAILIGHRGLRADALDEVTDRVDVYASAIKVYVDSARSVLETTVSSPSIGRLALDRNRARFIRENTRVFEYVMLVGLDGTVSLIEPRTLERQLSQRDLSLQAWYRDVIRTGATVVSDLHISPATRRPTVIIATPVRSPDGDALGIGQITGIWAGAIELAELSRLGRSASRVETAPGYGYVTDSRGLIIAHQGQASYVENQTDFSAVPTVRAALAGRRGAIEFVDPIEGEAKIGGYRPIKEPGWAAAYVVPIRQALAPIDRLTRGIVVSSVALAVAMGGGSGSWWPSASFTRSGGSRRRRAGSARATTGTGSRPEPVMRSSTWPRPSTRWRSSLPRRRASCAGAPRSYRRPTRSSRPIHTPSLTTSALRSGQWTASRASSSRRSKPFPPAREGISDWSATTRSRWGIWSTICCAFRG